MMFGGRSALDSEAAPTHARALTGRGAREESEGKARGIVKRIFIVSVGAALMLLLSTGAASAFGVKDVVAMTKDGVADSLILQKIAYSRTTFHLDAGDMRTLKSAGVSDEVISAMLRTESGARDEYVDGYPVYGPYYYPHYYYPYYPPYPYYYGPYYPYYPRFSVSLGFGFRGGHFGHFRGGHFYGRRF